VAESGRICLGGLLDGAERTVKAEESEAELGRAWRKRQTAGRIGAELARKPSMEAASCSLKSSTSVRY